LKQRDLWHTASWRMPKCTLIDCNGAISTSALQRKESLDFWL
jgi:hypothetical protein